MNKLLVVVVLSIICIEVWSQGKLKSQAKFGFKFGSGMQAITGCPFKNKPRIAFMGGMWVRIKISKIWAMQAELTQIGKGTGLGLQQNTYGDYWLNLNYFEVPILFQYNKQNIYFEFGPSLAVLINSGEYTDGYTLPYQTEQYPINNKDFSFNLGTGYVFNDKWRVGLRLTHSLLPVRNQLPGASMPVYNRGIILAISRQINFKASRTKQSEDVD
jgi:Outer membrane protein beta-barrel domain